MGNRKQPFGYKMALGEIVIQESEAKLVQEIFLRYIAGESLNELTESLRQQDIPYDEGRLWNKNMVARILADTRYTGEKGYPKLIDEEQLIAANEKRSNKPQLPKKTEAQKVLRRLCGTPPSEQVEQSVTDLLNGLANCPDRIRHQRSPAPVTHSKTQETLDNALEQQPIDEDSAKVLGRFFDGIEYRGYEQSVVEDLAKWSGVPVWNGLTDADHPTQILADLMTIEEHCKKPLNKIKVVFPGDVRNNMCYAWMMGAAKLGMHFVAMGPEELAKQMDQEVVQSTFAEARKNGGLIEITDHAEDLKGADVIYGDVWASMGEEAQIPERVGLLSPFRVTMDTLKATENPDVLYLHCLPSFHDFETKMAKEWQAKGVDIREVTDEVFRSRHSVVFDEAENRMHSIKAVMVATIGA